MPAHDPDPARPAPAAAVACEAGAGPSATDDRSKRILPWLVAVGFFMQTLDGTILNTALPAMARDLHESPLRMQSVVLELIRRVRDKGLPVILISHNIPAR